MKRRNFASLVSLMESRAIPGGRDFVELVNDAAEMSERQVVALERIADALGVLARAHGNIKAAPRKRK